MQVAPVSRASANNSRVLLLIYFGSLATAQYSYGPAVGVGTGGDAYVSPAASQPGSEGYNKAFYTYSAPEEELDDFKANEKIAHAVRKNLRVIFIKSPENTALENAVLQLARGAAVDRTAIYLFSKQPDVAALVNQLQHEVASSSIKPEVHFVKYRTPAEAENAQRVIQAHYESLPGTSTNNSPTSAAVLDFAANNNAALVTSTSAPSRTSHSSRNVYLPPKKRY